MFLINKFLSLKVILIKILLIIQNVIDFIWYSFSKEGNW